MVFFFAEDRISAFWRASVSQRELWSIEHYDSLVLDPRDARRVDVWFGLNQI